MVPIPKGQDSSLPSNLRPISLIPIAGKILEISLNSQLREFFEHNKILMKEQHGFRSEHSTNTAIYEVLKHVSENMDEKKIHNSNIF